MSAPLKLTKTQQSAAVDRLTENLALLSGAGCGKTTVLARRFTELLLRCEDIENPLSRFVALTFTEKAAIEMSQRVRRMLRDFAARSSGADRKRLLGWVQELPDARISTIHGFCASLLRTHAIEAGIDPEFSICSDEVVTKQMIREATEQAILRAVETPEEGVCEVLTLLGYDRCVEEVRRLLDMRTGWELSEYDDPQKTLQRWAELLAAEKSKAGRALAEDPEFIRELERIESAPCPDPSDKLALHRQEQCEILHQVIARPENCTPQLLEKLRPKPGRIGSAKNWGSPEQLKEIRSRINELVARTADLALCTEELGPLDAQAAEVLRVLTYLSNEAATIYSTEKRRRGLLDFTDLLDAAYRFLSQDPIARKHLSESIDQLLLDEAQDTDAFQMKLLELIVFQNSGEHTSEEGRLFVVGDAKQSIYRFRGAQVEVFQDLCARLGPRHAEHLDESFRTHPGGIEFVNDLFSQLMGTDYEPIRAHRSQVPTKPSVEIILGEPHRDAPIESTEQATQVQAAALAKRIGEMVDNAEPLVWDEQVSDFRAVEYRDIAVLFARMTIAHEYERQLTAREIPYCIVAGMGFFQQQEVLNLLNALGAIDNCFDDIALFGTLRSSLFGLDDNALMHICEALDPPYFPALVKAVGVSGEGPRIAIAGLSEDQSEALRFAVELLDDLRKRKDAVSIDSLLEELLDETAYEAVLLSQSRSGRVVGNVRQLVALAREASPDGANLGQFIAQVREQLLSESRYEQAPAAGEHENVVRLVTIHKAKGLEFPVVLIPDLNFSLPRVQAAILNRADWGLTYKLKADGEANDSSAETALSHRIATMRENADRQREDIRKFYVAATRHRDHLIFVGANWRGKDGQLKEPGGYLRKMDQVLGFTKVIDSGADALPYGDGRYRAAVRKIIVSPVRHRRRSNSPPGRALSESADPRELAGKIIASVCRAAPARLLGPLPVSHGRAELSVTALSEFEQCPMLYRWGYELKVPTTFEGAHGPSAEDRTTLDPATAGTFYHRCMELLDPVNPQPAEVLVRRTAREMNLEESPHVDLLAREFEGMLDRFRAHRLFAELSEAPQIHRELDFVLRAGSATLRGRIDLLYQNVKGDWRIVDYKSDRVDQSKLDAHAQRYELQMLLYAAAVQRHLAAPPNSAVLYFLRSGATFNFKIDPETLAGSCERAGDLAEQLITSRRSRRFARSRSQFCERCGYRQLCP